MKVLVLGGYGLIGSAVVEKLLGDGHEVVGLGRDPDQARIADPCLRWIAADMAGLAAPQDWIPLLAGIEAVVNAAGALQDGARDDLDAIHRKCIVALAAACEEAGVRRFVQISAVGAAPGAVDPFFRTKGEGDRAVRESSLDWTIFRPGLVVAPAAYGGTALLRALAAVPGFVPAVMADRVVQTVSVRDVACAVSQALAGSLPSRLAIDLVEQEGHSLGGLLLAFRAWLGLPPARIVAVPALLGAITGAVADMLGRLGWRSPLRSAALVALSRGVSGDPRPWAEIAGRPLSPLAATLAAMPATVQERWFARLWLLKPVILACLSLFWLASGAIGLARLGMAADVLASRGVNESLARMAVAAGGVADLAVGVAVLVRPLARWALWAMIGITLCYIFGASVLTPDLWLDPLGPLVKTLPGLCLALVGLAVLDER